MAASRIAQFQVLEQREVLDAQASVTSSVNPLPAFSEASFFVTWSGSDTGGPGIASFSIFVSDNGGPFTAWLTGTTATSATYQGTLGHTYGFYSVATDAAGHVQPTPAAAQTSTQATLTDPNAAYVVAVYQDVLGRLADPAGLQRWTQLLDGGLAFGSVAVAFAHSAEYYANFVIKPGYLKLLARPADAASLEYWTSRFQTGLTDQQFEAGLVASDEFYANAGGTNTAWIDSIYKLLLGRAADAGGESHWNAQLSSGASRLAVANQIAGSAENNTDLINADYEHFLGRAADAGGLSYWLQLFAAGASNEDVVAGFAGSLEYYRQFNPNYTPPSPSKPTPTTSRSGSSSSSSSSRSVSSRALAASTASRPSGYVLSSGALSRTMAEA